jgi:hypothetical protein
MLGVQLLERLPQLGDFLSQGVSTFDQSIESLCNVVVCDVGFLKAIGYVVDGLFVYRSVGRISSDSGVALLGL